MTLYLFCPWCCFKSLSFAFLKIRDSIQIMEKHKHLVAMDCLVTRSWMCLLGLDNLFNYASIIPLDVLDTLQHLQFSLTSGENYKYEVHISLPFEK